MGKRRPFGRRFHFQNPQGFLKFNTATMHTMSSHSTIARHCLAGLVSLFLLSGISTGAVAQDCTPEWTVGITVYSAADTALLQLVMDADATLGFDAGLDTLCTADASGGQACLVSSDTAFSVSAIPSNGEDGVPFYLTVSTDSSGMVLEFDLSGFLMDGASLTWIAGGDTTLVDLLLDPVVMLPGGLDGLALEGLLDPSCAIPGCTDEAACNFNPEATEEDGSCTYPFFCFDCNGECLCDVDEDGVCDPLEFPGCTDPEACNWAPVYTEEDGSCFYAQPGFDCAGFCLPVDNDECGFAEPIACGQLVSASTVCADTTESDYCDQYNIGEYFHGGLWYTIMGTGDTLRATLCFEETGYDTYLSVYEGDCSDLNCVAGNDDQDETNFFAEPCFENFLSSSVDWESEAGVEYFLHVSGSNAVTPAVGGFDFVLICDGVEVEACLDSLACNFNPFGTVDDGSCDYATCAGCGLLSACNFDSTAFINDFSLCDFGCYGCTDAGACNFNPEATTESGLCEYSSCAGCLDPLACNHDTTAILDAGNCEYTSCVGCTDEAASNYNPGATQEDGSCTFCDLLLSAPAVTGVSCFGAGDGEATIALDSALTDSVYFELTAPGFGLSEVWTDGVFSDLAPGNYLLEVFDGDSTCSAVRTFSVASAPDVALFGVSTSPLCPGGVDGAITAFVSEAVTPVAYLVNGATAALSGNFLGLSAGSYLVEVEVTMPSGGTCVDATTIVVSDPEGMMITLDSVNGADPNEENGGVSITVEGGAAPYTFNWSGPSGGTGMEDPDDLASGEWTLVVTDDDGCTASLQVTVPVGVEEWAAMAYSVMPNPTRGAFTLQFERPFSGEVILMDATGRTVERWASRAAVQFSGQLAHRAQGVYFIRAVNAAGLSKTVRLVKQD